MFEDINNFCHQNVKAPRTQRPVLVIQSSTCCWEISAGVTEYGWNVAVALQCFHFISDTVLPSPSRYSKFMLWICFAKRVPCQHAFKCFLTLGTALHTLIKKWVTHHIITHSLLAHTYMHPHSHADTFTCANIHTHIVVKLWGWEVLSICLCTSVFYTLFSCTLFFLSLSFSLSHSVPIVSHLFPHLPSFPLFPTHLLSSLILPYRLLLSVNFKVGTDSVFCRYVVFKAS